MRLKIVVQDPPWLTRLETEWKDAWGLLCAGVRWVRQLLCGLRGHDYQLKMHHRRLSLYCRECEHTTAGWDLSDPTPKVSEAADRPQFLELLRKRG